MSVGWDYIDSWVTAVVDFYNQINLLYGSITEFCSPQSCPEMKATDEYAAYQGPGELCQADGRADSSIFGKTRRTSNDQPKCLLQSTLSI